MCQTVKVNFWRYNLWRQALRKYNIPFESHIYPKGGHGLSLGKELTNGMSGTDIQAEVTTRVELAKTFVENL